MSSGSDANGCDENQLKAKAKVMFDKTSDYLSAELNLTLEDYQLLEDMNNATTERYKEMTDVTVNLAQNADQ
ncbi:unnamed protein product, partial [Oppiella nova]